MYDQPEYDPFWAAVQELDTVVYMHPRIPVPHIQKELWDGRKALGMATLQFGQDVQRHTLGLVSNGVFDRFPGVKFIIGHMGEMIPAHLWRIGTGSPKFIIDDRPLGSQEIQIHRLQGQVPRKILFQQKHLDHDIWTLFHHISSECYG